jgi:hypoxanthine-DNA glycosylase
MKILRSFKPIIDENSRILILGSMPGPEALRRKEYYGFPGNHFWPILFEIFDARFCEDYRKKTAFLRENRIALWDVVGACVRPTALDSHIRNVQPNPVPALVKKYPRIQKIFLNGRLAQRLFYKYFDRVIGLPAAYLPSTSPAHASMSYDQKRKRWAVIKESLVAPRLWC